MLLEKSLSFKIFVGLSIEDISVLVLEFFKIFGLRLLGPCGLLQALPY